MKLKRLFRFDMSTIVLIIANIVTIIFAVVQQWNIVNVLWLYLVQSVIIGFFTCLRILSLKQFSAEGISDSNDQPIELAQQAKLYWAKVILRKTLILNAVFAVLLYLIFSTPHLDGTQVTGYTICILVFLTNNGFSYFYNRSRDRKRKLNIENISYAEGIRLIPMLMGILFIWPYKVKMQESMTILIFLLCIKTIVDVTMHNFEHYVRQEEEQTSL